MKSNVDKICWKARVKTLDAVAEREREREREKEQWEGEREEYREREEEVEGSFNWISLHATLIFHFFLRRFSNFVDFALSPKTLLHFFVSCSRTKPKKRRSKNESKKILLAKADLNFHLTEANNAANDDDDDVNVVNACRWFPDPIVETVGIVFAGIFVVATGRVGSCVPVCVYVWPSSCNHKGISSSVQYGSARLVLVAASSSSSSLLLSLNVVQWSMLHYFADPQVMHSCSILFSEQTALALALTRCFHSQEQRPRAVAIQNWRLNSVYWQKTLP